MPVSSTITSGVAPRPFVKWAGGKRQLIAEITLRLPRGYNHYIEPFVGGGAVLFELMPETASVNDMNESLINVYEQIKSNPVELLTMMRQIDIDQLTDPKKYFYNARDEYNLLLLGGHLNVRTAALFIYLNKHCFNGLYRVNAKGMFNVPYNGSTAPSFSHENINAVSRYLQSVSISCGDFSTACAVANKGDFVFFDSPYAPINPTSFEAYTKEGFSLEDHTRLAQLFHELTDRGCHCMLTNHNTTLIQSLYSGYHIDVVTVRRSINSDSSKRHGTEVIVRNY